MGSYFEKKLYNCTIIENEKKFIFHSESHLKNVIYFEFREKKFIKAAHDVSLGGIITALSKMCIKGKKGVTLKKPSYLINQFEYLFGEDQGRYIIEIDVNNLKDVIKILSENSVHFDELGTVNDGNLIIDDKSKVSIDDLIKMHTIWLTNYMSK